MSKSRMPMYLGLAAAGAGGYYLYNAGGDPSTAKHQMRIDAEKARQKMPGSDNAESTGTQAGANVDDAIARARAEGKEARDKLEGLRDDAKTKFNAGVEKVNAGVDQVDRDVEKKAAEAKGAVSGWFGGKK
ncbi:uncharacterized protein N7515_006676 [Penicillium bovifimosum]|uniref:Calcofluor white hypersensitive protein n=1 Tax=Penicillium bovifimosum TaxID=126998 RepID=A0A9W9L1G8_9EURO|nr:uncharacterized protein N7515_006676 [Penicillium bovifimosum]KAJ5130637.1 hypothetical protein N7515_006676 [Penicillium bovifimosum]